MRCAVRWAPSSLRPFGAPCLATAMTVLLVAFGGQPAYGQNSSDVARPGPATALEKLEAGQRLRVELVQGRREEGRFRGLAGDSLVLGDGRQVTFSIDELEGIWTRGNSVKAGALIGGGVGLAVGVVVGAWLGDFACAESRDENCSFAAALAVGGLGAAGGAGLGAVTGLLVPRWQRRWP